MVSNSGGKIVYIKAAFSHVSHSHFLSRGGDKHSITFILYPFALLSLIVMPVKKKTKEKSIKKKMALLEKIACVEGSDSDCSTSQILPIDQIHAAATASHPPVDSSYRPLASPAVFFQAQAHPRDVSHCLESGELLSGDI